MVAEKIRVEENNKPQFTKDIEDLLRKTRALQNVEITYGSLKHEPVTGLDGKDVVVLKVYNKETDELEPKLFKRIFTPSDRNLEEQYDAREYVQIKVDGKTLYQSVEADSYWGMVLDIIRRLDKEGV
jgi:hypothetical protein